MTMLTKDVTQGVVSTIADDALVMVANGSQWSPIKFSDLAKAVRGSLQIGGRNYAVMGKATLKQANRQGSHFIQSYADSRTFFWLQIGFTKADNSYVSVVGDTIATVGRRYYQLSIPEGTRELTVKHNGETRDFGVVFPIKVYGSFMLGVTIDNITQGSFEISDIKLEKGNVATDWTPAPEDIASGNWGG